MLPVTLDTTLREWHLRVVIEEQSRTPQRDRKPPSYLKKIYYFSCLCLFFILYLFINIIIFYIHENVCFLCEGQDALFFKRSVLQWQCYATVIQEKWEHKRTVSDARSEAREKETPTQ